MSANRPSSRAGGAEAAPGSPRSGTERLVGRVGGHSLVYALSSSTAVLAGLLSVVVLTRYLAPAEFGQLAILLSASALLTVLYNAGSLQGTFQWVFGGAGDDELPEEDEQIHAGARDRRRALCTGLAITLGLGVVGTALVALASEPIASLLIGDRDRGELVIGAAAGAAAAAVWRLAANVTRLERRPWTYFAVTAVQHLLGLAIALPLLAAGRGIGGVITGMALGNAAAAALALACIRRSIRPAVSRSDAAEIIRRGRAMLPVVTSFQLIQLGDVLFLSWFAPNATVGIYRVATRFGALITYWTASFHMAWGPLRRDAVHVAADAERGRRNVAAMMAAAFVLITIWAVLAATLLADELIDAVAPGYDDAAPLIPLTAIGFAFHGLFVLAYRTAEFPRRRVWFIRLAVVNASVFVLSSLVLIPMSAATGAALAVILSWSVGIAALTWRGFREPERVPHHWLRMGAALAIAVACFGMSELAQGVVPSLRLPIDLLAIALYPALVVGLRVVPGRELGQIARAQLAGRGQPVPRADLSEQEERLIERLLRHRRDARELAEEAGTSEEEIRRRLVRALRRRAGLGEPQEWDGALGAYLLLQDTFADRQIEVRKLFDAGADPLDVDAVARAAATVKRRRVPRRPGHRPPSSADTPGSS